MTAPMSSPVGCRFGGRCSMFSFCGMRGRTAGEHAHPERNSCPDAGCHDPDDNPGNDASFRSRCGGTGFRCLILFAHHHSLHNSSIIQGRRQRHCARRTLHLFSTGIQANFEGCINSEPSSRKNPGHKCNFGSRNPQGCHNCVEYRRHVEMGGVRKFDRSNGSDRSCGPGSD